MAGDTKDHIYTDREEKKFIVKQSDLDMILNTIEFHMKASYPDRGTKFTITKTTYFDTTDLKFLKQHLNDESTRYKLRMREYGPNGEFGDARFLEVKYKENDIKKKARIKINEKALAEIVGGKQIPEKNAKLNKDQSQEEYETAKHLIEQVSKEGVTPVLAVQYKRLSYASRDLRVTVDTGYKETPYAALKAIDKAPFGVTKNWGEFKDIGTSMIPNTDAIVEVKYPLGNEAPKWLTQMLNHYKKSGDKPFSKYVYGMYQELK